MYDFRKLETFCKVFELNSFSKASDVLFISQPTVSAHIQSLEQELNTRLFDRMARTVLPTPAGEVLFHHTQKAFACLQKAHEEIGTLFSDITGEIHIGSTTIPAHYILPKLFSHFLKKYPKVRPSLTIETSDKIIDKVFSGNIYAGIVNINSTSKHDLHFTPLFNDPIVIIAPPTIDSMLDELNEEPITSTLTFETAVKLPWIMQKEGSTTRTIFEETLREKGYDPRDLPVRLVVDNSQSVVQYVSAGLGISIASHLSVAEALRGRRLRALSIQGLNPTLTFSSVINTKRAIFPTTSLFLDFLRTQINFFTNGQKKYDPKKIQFT